MKNALPSWKSALLVEMIKVSKFQSVYDPVLNEDVAWRFDSMSFQIPLIEKGRAAVPDFELRECKVHNPDWDHEHCLGCGDKIMEDGVLGTLSDGYVAGEFPDDIWLCKDCHRLIVEFKSGIRLLEISDE